MAVTTATTQQRTTTWSVDPSRSRVEFQAKHLGISPVRGAFEEFEGTLRLSGDDLAGARGSVSVASLDTKQARRDAHLRSPTFFDAERFPKLTFASTAIRALDGQAYEIAGDLTIHGVTRAITLTAELQGIEADRNGNRRLRLAAAGRLNRREFGMTRLGVVVSSTIELRLEISAVEEAGR